MPAALRRIVLLLAAMAAAGAAVAAMRRRQSAPAGPAEWPPFEPRLVATPPTEPATAPRADRASPEADAEVVAPSESWVGPTADGSAPDGHPIKVNTTSGIFHVPGGRFYGRTVAERHYATADAAIADGYRQSKT